MILNSVNINTCNGETSVADSAEMGFINQSLPTDFWYTPPEIMDLVTEFFSHFSDPCPVDPLQDGLKRQWDRNSFINPPYSTILRDKFVEKGIEEFERLGWDARFLWLLNYGTSEVMWEVQKRASAVCMPRKRIHFIPGHPDLYTAFKAPRYDSVFVLWGDHTNFAKVFGKLGKVYYQSIEDFL